MASVQSRQQHLELRALLRFYRNTATALRAERDETLNVVRSLQSQLHDLILASLLSWEKRGNIAGRIALWMRLLAEVAAENTDLRAQLFLRPLQTAYDSFLAQGDDMASDVRSEIWTSYDSSATLTS